MRCVRASPVGASDARPFTIAERRRSRARLADENCMRPRARSHTTQTPRRSRIRRNRRVVDARWRLMPSVSSRARLHHRSIRSGSRRVMTRDDPSRSTTPGGGRFRREKVRDIFEISRHVIGRCGDVCDRRVVSVGGGLFDGGSGSFERAVMRSMDDDDDDDDDDTRRRAVGCVRSRIVRSGARGRRARHGGRDAAAPAPAPAPAEQTRATLSKRLAAR